MGFVLHFNKLITIIIKNKAINCPYSIPTVSLSSSILHLAGVQRGPAIMCKIHCQTLHHMQECVQQLQFKVKQAPERKNAKKKSSNET